MRIAVLTPGYAPDPGGVESVVTALCEGLARKGVHVEVWAHRGRAGAAGPTERAGVTVRRFATTRSHRFPLSPALWSHARAHAGEFDLLHAHSFHATAALGAAFTARNVPLVFTPHYHGSGHTPLARLLHVPYRPIGAELFRRADVVVAVSRSEQDALGHDRPRLAGRLRTVQNAVDVGGIHAAAPIADEPPTALVLGRMEGYKRADIVLAAFGRARTPSQLVIIGDGPDRPRLEALAAGSPRHGDIRVLGRLPRADVDRWLRTARCVVSMSEHEAFGIVGLEAVAAGARALLSDLPAHREVVELAGTEHAAIVAPDALPAALDDALGARPGQPRHVRDWTAAVEEYLAIYADVLAASRRHQRR